MRLRGWVAVAGVPIVFSTLVALFGDGCADKEKRLVLKVASIQVEWRREAVLEDVCSNGSLLLDGIGMRVDRPRLLIWDPQAKRSTFEIPMDYWRALDEAAIQAHKGLESGPFKCVNNGTQAVALQGDYLVLIDFEKKAELKRFLASGRDPAASINQVMWQVTRRTVVVNPIDGTVAAIFNTGQEPRAYVYTPDLEKVMHTWALPRYMQDACWSPDGRKLAVLYSGGFDGSKRFVGASPDFEVPPLPDVELFDADSGRSVLTFFSGDLEAQIACSPDGNLIYTISRSKYNRGVGRWNYGAVRAFSTADGRLVGTMTIPRTGVRNSFAVSPDGRFIVADGSTPVPDFLWLLRESAGSSEKLARFGIFHGQTGKLLYTHEEKSPGHIWGYHPLRFGFSPDSRLLYLDPNYADTQPGAHVDVYSLDGLK